MSDLIARIRTRINDSHMDIERLLDEAADEIERLLAIEAAARKLTFGSYPAHGTGFVTILTGGNTVDLDAALGIIK